MSDDVFDDGLRITTRRVDHNGVLVEIVGELDLHTVSHATAFLTQVNAVRPRHLILDLSGVTFLASPGLAFLIAAQSGCDEIRGQLHLLGVIGNHPVERPLDLVGLRKRFDVANDLNTLIARLDTTEPEPTDCG